MTFIFFTARHMAATVTRRRPAGQALSLPRDRLGGRIPPDLPRRTKGTRWCPVAGQPRQPPGPVPKLPTASNTPPESMRRHRIGRRHRIISYATQAASPHSP